VKTNGEPKRKRGRPRKNPLPQFPAVTVAAVEEKFDTADKSLDSALISASPLITKKRGRKPRPVINVIPESNFGSVVTRYFAVNFDGREVQITLKPGGYLKVHHSAV
jgi:hypothetical protein